MSASEKLVLALDVPDLESAEELVNKLKGCVKVFKVGTQLFTTEGAKVIDMINKKNCKVFLDLKFHDIPNTVKGAVESAVNLGVYIIDVHASGGYEMMKAAADAAKQKSKEISVERPLILGVTVLTSINQEVLNNELNVDKDLNEQVVCLAKLAKSAGLDGVVASPNEIKKIRDVCGDDFVILTPGIRHSKDELNDQKRVMTPRQAIKQGADFIVVGRPIRNAINPVEAAKDIINEMEER
ncbi:MAG: orotidine-5'-phosphate decarboxylase [Candidatus Nanoarchaeia archaeon]|nr:orotidine-5'-phosphate decarboxylase [Candidatus Nanoarchaeia archaeon]